MDDLNKNQLILLTLLVSFVTSIATGIITTSLLQEAPPGVTQVINRVVEKTIEQVAIDTGGKETVKEVTVVVKEEDQVIDSISKNNGSVARISDTALVDGVAPFYGMGFLLTADGIVAGPYREGLNNGTTYSAVFGDGAKHQMKLKKADSTNRIAFFQIIKDQNVPIKTKPVSLGAKDPQLGQSVIALDGREKNNVAIGRVTGLTRSDGEAKDIISIETDIVTNPSVLGAPLLNLSGEVVGIRITLDATGGQTFLPAHILQKSLNQ